MNLYSLDAYGGSRTELAPNIKPWVWEPRKRTPKPPKPEKPREYVPTERTPAHIRMLMAETAG